MPMPIYIPTMSLKSYKGYTNTLANKKTAYWLARTQLTAVGTKNRQGISYNRIEFQAVGEAGPETFDKLNDLHRAFAKFTEGMDAEDFGMDAASEDSPF
jgi:hypothetical protein